MPTVLYSFVKTIALDFTFLQTLNAKISLFKVSLEGFNYDTTLKSFLEKIKLS